MNISSTAININNKLPNFRLSELLLCTKMKLRMIYDSLHHMHRIYYLSINFSTDSSTFFDIFIEVLVNLHEFTLIVALDHSFRYETSKFL